MGPTTTSRTSAASARREPRSGFTLIELIVAISIIVILLSIIAPLILRAYRNGRLTRIAGDLQAVSQALEAYRHDFGDYPRMPVYPGAPDTPSTGTPGVMIADTGAAVLGKALLGTLGNGLVDTGNTIVVDTADPPAFNAAVPYKRGDVVANGAPRRFWVSLIDNAPGSTLTNPKQWAYFDPRDGADGPGTRAIKTIDLDGDGIPDIGGGKVSGPYLQLDAVKVSGSYILDHEGKPILYFPTKPGGKSNLTLRSTGANESQPYADRFPLATNAPPAQPYINVSNNFEAFRRDATEADNTVLARIRGMVGDWDVNGTIADQNVSPYYGPETALDKPYLLWSSGLDGFFGPTKVTSGSSQAAYDDNRDAAQECDDVTNFK